MKNNGRSHRAWLLAAFCAASGTALATVGPDVIVGDMPDVTHWGNQTVSGVVIEAYSVGTTSCNVGDTPLQWIANTNQHPVISGNMYRLDPALGRFEQIGQSWLKHGFTALQGTVCFDDCQAYPNGSHLGVHCSDPYGSSLNGSQGGLGPKFEVNASSGVYPYPFTNSAGSGTIFKRLQVHRPDLQNAGASYFVACQYVDSDDAQAGNGMNNESYRRITVNGTNYDIDLVDSTQRGRSAIYAWKDHGLGAGHPDPDVYINILDIPGDGRFLVGAKATDLGNGRWRYEYAVENLNSYRSAQQFSIPLPGVVSPDVSNVGFHDVDYHSGEPFVGTDWTASASGSSVTWASQTLAQNVNANALRWGTLYNYRFECAVPPATGMATITTFRTPAAFTVPTVIPSPDGMSHPLNDACGNPADAGVGPSSFAFDTTGASTDGGTVCSVNGFDQINADLWYSWVAPVCGGPVTVSTCGSDFDTKIAVYAGGSCPSGAPIACSDASISCGDATRAEASFNSTAGAAYLIRVGGAAGASGSGMLTIDASDCTPANDDACDAFPLADGVAQTGSTSLATVDGTANCGNSDATPDVWFTYHPAVSGNVVIHTCGSTYDTVLSIYSGDCGNLTQLTCNDDNPGVGPCAGGLTSYISRNLSNTQTYYIRVSGYDSNTGTYVITAVGGGGTAGPANDLCEDATVVTLGETPFSSVDASTDGPAHALCDAFSDNNVSNDVWFVYHAQCDGVLTVDTCTNAGFDTKLAVYADEGCTDFDARILACSDDACAPNASSVDVTVASGQSYMIRVGGYNGATGLGTLHLACSPQGPSCDPDVNCDGNLDGFDVQAMEQAIGGDTSDFCQADADFNHDGNLDGFDVQAVEAAVGGAPCP